MICPLCKEYVKYIGFHIHTKHPSVTVAGDIIWLNKEEAIYKGKRYTIQTRKGGPTVISSEAALSA